ncbi:hypothetical protein HCN44_010068 [Aphidius gifuensis]|uniref:Large ribosomal subunit protein bL19m n=1 Tax=Aphidius gifuensis TaxID=684658 RepID=A0A834XVV8_APHGI|nr:hypothetical protein HCN44_010068 [Aphidius gifuensis]
MSLTRILSKSLRLNFQLSKCLAKCFSTTISSKKIQLNTEEKSENVLKMADYDSRGQRPIVPSQYRHIYPEFLPDPKQEFRNKLREKLERTDMMARRSVIDIPEFYVGSIVAVTYSEPHAPNKTNRFLGICIQRTGCGLRAAFVLRNVVDHMGIEKEYYLYDPTIQQIECKRLEKRLDDELLYLRDAPPEYSTFPLDMETEFLPDGAEVPVNKIVIPLKERPWRTKWELHDMKGLLPETVIAGKNRMKRAAAFKKPWEKYDLMKIYRETIPDEEQQAIYSEVHSKLNQLELSRKKMKRKRGFVRPTKEH